MDVTKYIRAPRIQAERKCRGSFLEIYGGTGIYQNNCRKSFPESADAVKAEASPEEGMLP